MKRMMHTARVVTAQAVFVLVLAQLAVAPAAHAVPPNWIQTYDSALLFFDPDDAVGQSLGTVARTLPNGQPPPVAMLGAHGTPGSLPQTGVDDVVRYVRNNFPGFSQAQHRVLSVCYGNVADSSGRTVAAAIAEQFGDVIAPNGPIHAETFAAGRRGAIHVYEGGPPVKSAEAWTLVRRGGKPPIHVSEAELYELLATGESPSVAERLAGSADEALGGGIPDLPGSYRLTPEDIEAHQQAWRQSSAEGARRRVQQLRSGIQRPSGPRTSGSTDGYVGGGRTATRGARLRSFARTTQSRAWSAVQRAPGSLARIGVGMGAGIVAGLPVEIAVTELTGSRHLGFAAGYGAGAFAGIGAEMMVFGTSFAQSASGAFSSVALWAAPAAVASHLMSVALDDLAAPIAAGDPQAIDLALELTEWGGAGFFFYGGRAWWNDPGGTASACFSYVTGH